MGQSLVRIADACAADVGATGGLSASAGVVDCPCATHVPLSRIAATQIVVGSDLRLALKNVDWCMRARLRETADEGKSLDLLPFRIGSEAGRRRCWAFQNAQMNGRGFEPE
jgi:hypothetical protein